MTTDDELLAARRSFDRFRWGDAYAGLAAADGRRPLASEDLERLLVAGAGRDARYVVDRIAEQVRGTAAARRMAPASVAR